MYSKQLFKVNFAFSNQLELKLSSLAICQTVALVHQRVLVCPDRLNIGCCVGVNPRDIVLDPCINAGIVGPTKIKLNFRVQLLTIILTVRSQYRQRQYRAGSGGHSRHKSAVRPSHLDMHLCPRPDGRHTFAIAE